MTLLAFFVVAFCLGRAGANSLLNLDGTNAMQRNLQVLSGNETQLQLTDIVLPVSIAPGIDAQVEAYNITCSGIRIQEYDFNFDVRTRSESDDIATLFANVHALSFALDCFFMYKYESTLANGNGTAVLKTSGNTLQTDALIVAPGTEEETLSTSNCKSSITVDSIEFLTVEVMAPILETVVQQPKVGDVFATKFCEVVSQSEVFYIFFGTLASTISNVATKDVLAAEADLVVADGTELVDFSSDTGNWPASAVNLAFDRLGPTLGQVSTQNDVSDLNINHMLRDFVLDENGAYVLNITNGTVFEGVDLFDQPSTFQFHKATITGLDRFTKFDDVTALSSQTLQANASIDSLYIQMQATLETSWSVDEVEVVLNVSNLDAVIAVMVAIDTAQLGEVPLGAFFDTDTMTSCLLNSIMDFQIADAIIDSLVIKPPSSDSAEIILAAGIRLKLDNVIRELVLQVVNQEVPTGTCDPAAIPSTGTPYVDFRDLFLEPSESLAYGGSGTQPYGNLTSTVKSYLDDEYLTMNETGQMGINSELIAPWTEENSGVVGKYEMTKPLILFDASVEGSRLDSRMSLSFKRVTFEGLDSFTNPVAIMNPVQNESAAIANVVSMTKFRATSVVELELEAPGLLRERREMEIGIDIDSFSVAASMFANVFEESLLNFPVRDVLDVNCWLAAVPASQAEQESLSLAELAISLGDIKLSIDCLDCSDAVDPAQALFSSDSLSLNSRTTDAVKKFLSDENIQRWLREAPRRCPHHKDYDPSVHAKKQTTAAKTAEDAEPSNMLIIALCLGLLLAISAAMLYYSAGWVTSSLHKEWLGTLSLARVVALRDSQLRERDRQDDINAMAGPMSTSSHVPMFIKVLVPLALVASSALFACGILAASTQAFIYVKLLEQDILVVDFKLTLLKLAAELWKGGGRVNAIVTVLTSMVLPNIKNLIVFALWFAPTNVIGTETRFNCVWWLNAVGKWCLCVVCVLIISTTAFRFTIASSIQSIEGDGLYGIEMLIVPVLGLYLWALGHLVSHVTGQLFMYYHGCAVFQASQGVDMERGAITFAPDLVSPISKQSSADSGDENDGSYLLRSSGKHSSASAKLRIDMQCRSVHSTDLSDEQLSDVEKTSNNSSDDEANQALGVKELSRVATDDLAAATAVCLNKEPCCRYQYGATETLRVRCWVNPAVVLLSMLAAAALVVGCFRPVYSFQASGFIANMVRDEGSQQETHSVFTLARLLLREASLVGDAKKLFGIGSIAVLVLLFVVIMPILHLATLLAQWFFAWKIEQLRKLNRLSELLQVWQLAEVFLLSLVFSGIQLSSLSEFVIGKYCDGLDAGVQALEDAGLMSANGETCYAATGSIEDGAFLLLVAVVLVGAIRLFIVEAARQKLSSEHSEVAAKVGTAASGDASRQDKEALIRQMNPPKVLFADRFRWFLHPVVEGCDETRF